MGVCWLMGQRVGYHPKKAIGFDLNGLPAGCGEVPETHTGRRVSSHGSIGTSARGACTCSSTLQRRLDYRSGMLGGAGFLATCIHVSCVPHPR